MNGMFSKLLAVFLAYFFTIREADRGWVGTACRKISPRTKKESRGVALLSHPSVLSDMQCFLDLLHIGFQCLDALAHVQQSPNLLKASSNHFG
jgi:hypothetical protein